MDREIASVIPNDLIDILPKRLSLSRGVDLAWYSIEAASIVKFVLSPCSRR